MEHSKTNTSVAILKTVFICVGSSRDDDAVLFLIFSTIQQKTAVGNYILEFFSSTVEYEEHLENKASKLYDATCYSSSDL